MTTTVKPWTPTTDKSGREGEYLRAVVADNLEVVVVGMKKTVEPKEDREEVAGETEEAIEDDVGEEVGAVELLIPLNCRLPRKQYFSKMLLDPPFASCRLPPPQRNSYQPCEISRPGWVIIARSRVSWIRSIAPLKTKRPRTAIPSVF
jgi:hypothetical protein